MYVEHLRMIKIEKTSAARVPGKHQLIPYNIYQTNENDEMASDMVMATDTVRENNPEYSYHFYNAT